MKKIICLLMIVVSTLFVNAQDSTDIVIKDTISFVQAQKEVFEYVSDNLSDIKARIQNSRYFIVYSRSKINDIQLYAGTGGCKISEYAINRMKETTNELDKALTELNKAKKTLDEKILNLDK